MGWGTRVRDASGNLQVEEGARYGRVSGFFDITAANSNVSGGIWTGSFNDPIFLTGTPWWAIRYDYASIPRRPVVGVTISVSGQTLNWSIDLNVSPAPNVTKVQLLYGVY
ncbi:hypothetical protein BV98_001435 [Sphingobium herbicidovorans NBRC 16415]|uniref:Uncharacterized protein n=1 Tax=Sphingobium herbicidovorans (strain ATCC 700291 / DSM 11019 / CCUG 56400 / KCTC 2939 / LMG 18315 / NBRC 16415 / MH) TaxID=1219045 RepID=A0A086PBF5_SPHHM|nr:hypothetical protein [Sphingobium herbicidovorans]KFG90723.1 hypothetical protein BV98_001435 [Sphingobium herbicidovorans NBRC 16415]